MRYALMALLMMASPLRADITLIADGKSAYTIVVPDGEDPRQRVGKAARHLRDTINEATGVTLPIAKEADFTGGRAIYLSRTAAAQKAGVPLDKLTGWTHLLRAVGEDVYLVGEDGPAADPQKHHNEFLGTLKAVTTFLEDFVGVRYVLPGPLGVDVPRAETIAVPADLDRITTPHFSYIKGRSSRDAFYDVANGYLHGASFFSYGGHSYYDAVPVKKYGETNPEYFALISGVRNPSSHHLCVSNADVQRLLVEEMLLHLDAGYDWVELAQTDGYVPCECDACNAIHEDQGERLWILHRDLAAQVEQRRPGKKVMIISYGPTRNPPQTFDRFPDNVIIQMCAYTPAEFARWAKFHVAKTVYLYNWGKYHVAGYGPVRTPRFVADQVRRFVAAEVKGIYLCGGLDNFGLEGPVFYVYGHMLDDPSRRWEDLKEEYYARAFGAARAPMKAFYDRMYERLELFSILSTPNFETDAYSVDAFRTPEDFFCYFFPPKLLNDMAANFERAKAQATDPRVKSRLASIEPEFRYTENLARIFNLYRAYRAAPSWATFDVLAAELKRRDALLDEWFGDSATAQTFDGWEIPFGRDRRHEVETGGRLMAVLGAPLNWDTDTLREKQVLPGVGSKTAKIAPISGITLDGVIDEPAWEQRPSEDLNEIGLGVLENATTFRMGYDDEAMYFAFTCEQADAEKLDVSAVGPDGKAYQNECIELTLDPFGQREKYYHFIFAPVANSYYDARIGFIDDPVHPLYGRADKSWNGDWQYAARIDVENDRWIAEVRIPYATLGVERPQPGATWTMNLGRENYPPGGVRHGQPALSLWSPNLESRSFHETSAFGTLLFQ